MKKLFISIICALTIILFYDTYSKYQIMHEDTLYGMDSINKECEIIVTFEHTIYEKNKDFIRDITNLANDYDVTIIKSDYDVERKIYNYYIYSQEDIDNLCDVVISDKIDFSNLKQDRYYSNTDNNSKVSRIFSIGNNMILNIKPISYLYDNHDIVGDYIFIGNNIEHYIKEVNDKYKVISNNVLNKDVDVGVEFHFNTTMLIISIIILVLIITGWLIKNKRVFNIYYLNGISIFKTIKDLYLNTFLLSMFVCVLIPILLFMIFIGEFNTITNKMFYSLLTISMIEIICLFVILLGMYVYLKFQFKIDGLSGNKTIKGFMNLNYVMKIIILLLLIPSVIQDSQELYIDYQRLDYIRNNYKGIEDYINIYNMDYHYQDLNYSQSAAINGEINYSIIEYQDNYDLLERYGAITFMYQPGDIDEYIVNYQYLNQFTIYDLDNNKLSLDLNTNNCFVLVPETLKDIDENLYKKDRNMIIKKVIISDNQPNMRNLDAINVDVINDNKVLFVYGKDYNIRRRNPYDNIYIKKDIRQVDKILKGSRFVGTLKWYSLDDYLKQTELRSPLYLFNKTIIIFLMIVLIIIILYENYCFYIKTNIKKIMIKKTVGISRLSIFKDLYLELLLCYCPVLIVCRNKILIPMLFLLLDGVLHLYVTNYIYNKKTVYYLKRGV